MLTRWMYLDNLHIGLFGPKPIGQIIGDGVNVIPIIRTNDSRLVLEGKLLAFEQMIGLGFLVAFLSLLFLLGNLNLGISLLYFIFFEFLFECFFDLRHHRVSVDSDLGCAAVG